MKKIFIAILSLTMFFSFSKVFATTYSDWSTLYPSGLDERLIESEVRYNWYKSSNGQITEFVDEFYAELDGYERVDESATTYYRYIMNNLFFNTKNELVQTSYCKKNWCYVVKYTEPTMVDLAAKDESEDEDMVFGIDNEIVPKTGDFIIYSVISLIAVLSLIILLVRKYKKVNDN